MGRANEVAYFRAFAPSKGQARGEGAVQTFNSTRINYGDDLIGLTLTTVWGVK